MTQSTAFARQHSARTGMTLRNDYVTGTRLLVCVEYGVMRDVARAEACNYSYREFWF